MKKLYSITGNNQKLDGGAMFGNVPKGMWQNWVEVDDKNRIDLACRCLLVKETLTDGQQRNILFEVGIGAFFDPKMKQRFGVIEDQHVLLDSLQSAGVTHEDIDVLVLSHLHFDHIGGLLSAWQKDKQAHLLFPNADILVGREAWERAFNPHYRDRASFTPEILQLLKERSRLHIVDSEFHELLGDDYRFHFSSGHTPGMMLCEIELDNGPMVFCADLIPGEPWVHLPITMGYDRFPEKLIDEKQELLGEMLSRNGRLFFTHDSKTACGTLIQSEKGRYSLKDCQTELVNAE